MTRAMVRRGPDDEGLFVSGSVGFGFRRLSIIDISSGHQPLSNEDGTIWAMLNGEIYGFGILRDELQSLGHCFKTQSDSEVIVHAYEEFGDSCFERLNGMFAIAIWDASRKRLLLARDRLGKKPLYWTMSEGTLWFASEMKSLLAANVIKREIDPVSLGLFFRTDCVGTPRAIYKSVHKLEPATAMAWSEGRSEKVWSFWKPGNWKFDIDHTLHEQTIEKLSSLIDASVAERLVSDVPLGLFLSGGLDSAIVAESAARQRVDLQAFTIGFEDPGHDETVLAQKTARALGLNHHVEVLKESDALDVLGEAVNLFDEPLADASILPTLLLSKFARSHVTVALSGDGGDELLLGYQHVSAHRFLNAVPRHFAGLMGSFASLLEIMPAGQDYFSLGFKLQRIARGLGVVDPFARDVSWRGSMTKKDLKSILLPEIAQDIDINYAETQLTERATEIPSQDFWQKWSWAYIRTFLMDEVLVKVDRATMWYSLEARAPLLDVRIVEFLLTLPSFYKLGAWGNKRLFKEILRGKVPDEVLAGKKHGFAVPVAKWLNGTLSKDLSDLLSKEMLVKQGLFNPTAVQAMVAEHRSKKIDRRKELWAMLMFQLWYYRWHSI